MYERWAIAEWALDDTFHRWYKIHLVARMVVLVAMIYYTGMALLLKLDGYLQWIQVSSATKEK